MFARRAIACPVSLLIAIEACFSGDGKHSVFFHSLCLIFVQFCCSFDQPVGCFLTTSTASSSMMLCVAGIDCVLQIIDHPLWFCTEPKRAPTTEHMFCHDSFEILGYLCVHQLPPLVQEPNEGTPCVFITVFCSLAEHTQRWCFESNCVWKIHLMQYTMY